MAFSRLKAQRAVKARYKDNLGKFAATKKKKYFWNMQTQAMIYNINKFWFQRKLPY